MKKKFFITVVVLVFGVVAGMSLKADSTGGPGGQTEQGNLLPEVLITCNADCKKSAGLCWAKNPVTCKCQFVGIQGFICKC
jgi:hypothetical protein